MITAWKFTYSPFLLCRSLPSISQYYSPCHRSLKLQLKKGNCSHWNRFTPTKFDAHWKTISATKVVFSDEGQGAFGKTQLKPLYLPMLNDLQNWLEYQVGLVLLRMPGTSSAEGSFALGYFHNLGKAATVNVILRASAALVNGKSWRQLNTGS